MRIAIAMRTFREAVEAVETDAAGEPSECFANFEVQNDVSERLEESDDDTVQVTVVLRGRRTELENPALGVTQLVLGALKAQAAEEGQSPKSQRRVIDAMGVAVTG
jgi:hypothetical protein